MNMSKYKEFFENIHPQTSDKELFAEIKGMARFRHRYTKRIALAVSAAIVVMMSSMTVLAYNLGFMDSVRTFFSDKNEVIPNNLNDVSVIKYENTFDDLDISVSGAVRDDRFTVIFIDIQRKDGGIFDTSDYILADNNGNEMIVSDGKKYVLQPSVKFFSEHSCSITSNGLELTETTRCYLVSDNDSSDNRITLAYCISDFKKDVCRTFRIDLENLYIESHYGSMRGEYIYLHSRDKESFSGRFLCEIDMENISSISEVITIQPNVHACIPVILRDRDKTLEPTQHLFTVKEISVSGITIKLNLEGERSETEGYIQTYGDDGIGIIILKDGTALPFGNETLPQIVLEHSDSDTWYFDGSFVLPQTIELDEISEIVIGETSIPLKDVQN